MIRNLVALFFIGSIGTAYADYSCSFYTPYGTSVTGVCATYELSSAEILSMNNYVATYYPLAVRETNASRRYNCHSYAWYSQSTANTVWLNSPQEDKYWLDGSYKLKATGYSNTTPAAAPIGAKVSYIYDDHSAIKVGASAFRSKWGQLPRMLHSPNYTPYTSNGYRYYAP